MEADIWVRKVLSLSLILLPLAAIGLGEVNLVKRLQRQYALRSRGGIDAGTAQDARLAPLRHILPEYGRIGYIDPDAASDRVSATRAFYLTQYALAPRKIARTADAEFVLYSSHTGRRVADDRFPEGLRVFSHVRPDLTLLIRMP